MPTATGRAFTTANFLANLAALKAINFGSSDPNGTWFIVPNQTTNNVEIWVWEPTSTATTNEIDVIRPDSIVSNTPGRCIQRLKFDASSLGGILATIAALNTAGLIERTADGSAAIVGLGAFGRSFLGSATDSGARTTLGLGSVNNTSDVQKPVSSLQQTAFDLKANLASPTFTGTPLVPTATAGTSTTQAASTAFVTTGLALKANLASPAFTGVPSVPTAVAGTNTTQAASTAFVSIAIASLVNSSPAVLDTLGELATALGNDPNFATTITNSLGLKAPLASPTFTGTVTAVNALIVPSVIGTAVGMLWRNSNNLEFKDSANATQILLSSSGNLSNLSDKQAALNTLVGIQTANRVLKSNGTNMLLAQVDLTADVTGSLPAANGGLTLTAQTFTGDKTFSGITRNTNTTQSTSTTTGANIVDGGQAIGGNLNVGGTIKQAINYTFRAALATVQSIPAATFTKINLTTEVTDTNNQYTAASARLVANTTEFWQLFIFITYNIATPPARIIQSIFKNNSEFLRVVDTTVTGNYSAIPVTILEIALAAGDYLEMFCYMDVARNVYGDATLGGTYWYGKRIN